MVGVQRAGQKTLIQETLNNGLRLSGEYRTINNQLLLVRTLNRVPYPVPYRFSPSLPTIQFVAMLYFQPIIDAK
jgi:hypothetical protein